MLRPWEDVREDPGGLQGSQVALTVWIEAECLEDAASALRCDFKWFNPEGRQEEEVRTGPLTGWPQLGNPQADAAVAGEGAAAGAAADQTVEPRLLRTRFEHSSVAVMVDCAFARRLAQQELRINLHFPDPNPPERPRPATAESTGDKKADPKKKAGKKGEKKEKEKEPEPVPQHPELTFSTSLHLASLLVPERRDALPSVEGCSKSVAGCPGLRCLRYGVSCNDALLSNELAAHLNPLLIIINNVRRLPQEQYKDQRYDHVSAVVDAFGERRTFAPSAVDAGGSSQIQSASVFFAGTWNQRDLCEYLRLGRVAVEVHGTSKTLSEHGAAQEKMPVQSSASSQQEPSAPSSASGHGCAHFSLGCLLNQRFPRRFAFRADLRPVCKAKRPRQRDPAESAGRVDVASLFGEGAKAAIAALDAKFAEPSQPTTGYLDAGSYITVSAAILRPLGSLEALGAEPEEQEVAPECEETPGKASAESGSDARRDTEEPFTRLVMVIDYHRTTVLKQLISCISDTNLDAMGLDTSCKHSLMQIHLTDEQKTDSTFDVITGFVVMDAAFRIVVLEGLGVGAMQRVAELVNIGGQKRTRKCKMLFNPTVRFPRRMYADFHLCLKQVRIRQSTLEDLMCRPSIYDRATSEASEQDAVHTLHSLMELKRAERLHSLKALDLFPTVQQLLALEMNYGDFVSDEELEGGRRKDLDDGRSSTPQTFTLTNNSRRTAKRVLAAAAEDDQVSDATTVICDDEHKNRTRLTMKLPLDTKNEHFDSLRTERAKQPPVNANMRHRAALSARDQANKTENLTLRPKKDVAALDGKPVHIYSCQKLNSVELQKEGMREQMRGKDGKCFWTYSERYNSGTFPLVDLESTERDAAPRDDGREPWRYPRPRTRSDYRRLDRDVSEARKEELTAPWIENQLHPELEQRPVVHGAFDAATLGTGGAHVLALRRPGLQDGPGPGLTTVEKPPARPPMSFASGFAAMGQQSTADKYHRGMLDGPPQCRGLRFETRRLPKNVTGKFGRNLEVPPISLDALEDYREDRVTSEHPFDFARRVSRPLEKEPPRRGTGRAEDLPKSARGCTTACSWESSWRNDGKQQLQKTLLLSARSARAAD